jgi:hypothetical protein
MKKYDDLSQASKFEYLTIIVRGAKKDPQNNNKWVFVVLEKDVCKKAFCALYSIGKKKFIRVMNSSRNHFLPPVHGNAGNGRKSEIYEKMLGWLIEFLENCCDQSPDSDRIYVPSIISKKGLFEGNWLKQISHFIKQK